MEYRLQLNFISCLAPSSFLLFCSPAQDDYLDLFGDSSVTGKIGTDIQDGKCSWLVVQCLQRASPEQRQILQVPKRGLWVPELIRKGIGQWCASGGSFVPQGHLTTAADIFGCHNWCVCCRCLQWGEAGALQGPLSAHGSFPQQRTVWPQTSAVPELRSPGVEEAEG